jgi:hypothetical protein
MGKVVAILVAIAILTVAFILLGNADQAQAQENYVWLLPLVHKNFKPHWQGCLEPDPAYCVYGPPFSPDP